MIEPNGRSKRRPGPRRRPQAAAGTREDLLRAGTEVFAQRGFDGARAESIARRAGANKAMINYHFGGKKGLYEAILTGVFAHIASRLAALRATHGKAPDQLREFIALFSAAATEHPAFPAMMLREVLSGGEHLTPELFARLLGIVTLVREIVLQGAREGLFRKVDPLLTHLSLVGPMLFFFATTSFRRRNLGRFPLIRPEPTTEAFVAHMQELMTRGLAADPATRRRT